MDVFYALAEPRRREIVELLARRGSMSATDICSRFQISPPAVSQHLKVLREAKLVHVEKRAQQRIYAINPEAMLEVEGWAGRMIREWSERFDALDKLLQSERSKPKWQKLRNKKKR